MALPVVLLDWRMLNYSFLRYSVLLRYLVAREGSLRFAFFSPCEVGLAWSVVWKVHCVRHTVIVRGFQSARGSVDGGNQRSSGASG